MLARDSSMAHNNYNYLGMVWNQLITLSYLADDHACTIRMSLRINFVPSLHIASYLTWKLNWQFLSAYKWKITVASYLSTYLHCLANCWQEDSIAIIIVGIITIPWLGTIYRTWLPAAGWQFSHFLCYSQHESPIFFWVSLGVGCYQPCDHA